MFLHFCGACRKGADSPSARAYRRVMATVGLDETGSGAIVAHALAGDEKAGQHPIGAAAVRAFQEALSDLSADGSPRSRTGMPPGRRDGSW